MQKELVFVRELDIAAWLALWLAIHGGDPLPPGVLNVDEETAKLVTTLSNHLASKFSVDLNKVSASDVEAKMKAVGFGVTHDATAPQARELAAFPAPGTTICTEVGNGKTYCFKMPKITLPPSGGPTR